jgi:Ca2+-binding RTX toxin-like protein
MTTQIHAYQRNLEGARSAAAAAREGLDASLKVLKLAGYVVSVLKKIDTDADRLEKVAAGLETVLKLVSKIGPLRGLARPLEDLIGSVEERMREVEASAEKLDSKFKPLGEAITAQQALLSVQIMTLGSAIDQIDSVRAGVDDAVRAIDETGAAALFGAAVANAEATVAPANAQTAVIDDARRAVADAEKALADAVAGFSGPGQDLADVFSKIRAITDSVGFLQAPLNAVAAVVRPIEWALDAADFVFNLVVTPVLDPVLNALGVRRLMQQVRDAIDLPTIAPFNVVDPLLEEIQAALTGPSELIGAIVAEVERLADETIGDLILGAINEPPTEGGEFVVGDDDNPDDNPGTTLAALGGADLIVGGLGDDTLLGGPGDDLLIGGRGDDVINGGVAGALDGGGFDGAVLLGGIGEFVFSSADDGRTVITSHVRGGGSQGVDRISNVDRVIFTNRVVAFEDFANVFSSQSGPATPDTVDGGPGNDFLFGGVGVDLLRGLGGDDYLEGRERSDRLEGGPGNDWLDGGPGVDVLIGGPGDDTASYEAEGDDAVYVALTTDRARTPFTPTETVQGIENLVGGAAVDWFWGDGLANRLDGGDGGDRINAFSGDDLIEGGRGRDQLIGGPGNDTVRGGDDAGDIFIGGLGADVYAGDARNDHLWYGGGGTDFWTAPFATTSVAATQFAGLPTLGFLPQDYAALFPARVDVDLARGLVRKFSSSGGLIGVDRISGVNSVMGAVGNDVLRGAESIDRLWGGAGDDVLLGGGAPNGAADVLRGGDGDDRLDPGPGRAFLDGGAGDDFLELDDDGKIATESDAVIASADVRTVTADGGAGVDTADFAESAREWAIVGRRAEGHFAGDIDPQTGDWRDVDIFTLRDIENIRGSRFDDLIRAMAGINVLNGHFGDDVLIASDNDGVRQGDTLIGGDGNDDLIGSRNDDALFGGPGADTLRSDDDGASGGLDTMDGGPGDDVFELVRGAVARLIGGPGVDIAGFAGVGGAVRLDLEAQTVARGFAGTTFDGVENLRGTRSSDHLFGDGAANKLAGDAGADFLFGRGADDVLYGNDGDDTLAGGDGQDLLFGGLGSNLLSGNAGIDTASYDPAQTGDPSTGAPDWRPMATRGDVVADLLMGRGGFLPFRQNLSSQTRDTLVGVENLIGGDGDDRIGGSLGQNVLNGGDGDDVIEGRGADDAVSGGDGDDVIYGDSIVGPVIEMVRLNADGESAPRKHLRTAGPFAEMPTGALTLELFVQLAEPRTTSARFHTLAAYGVAGRDETFQLQAVQNSGGDQIRVTIGGTEIRTGVPTAAIADGGIHRLSVSLDPVAQTLAVYVDGAQRWTGASSAVQALPSGGRLIFGYDENALTGAFSSSQALRGALGDIRIYDEVRTPKQIAEAWRGLRLNREIGPELVANWRGSLDGEDLTDRTGGAPLTYGGGASVADLRTVGLDGDDILNGGAGDDVLHGGGGDDSLDGGPGADAMTGGAGDDTYFVDDIGDMVIEAPGGGVDLVRATSPFVAGPGVENILLDGGGGHAIVGNAGSNTLRGNGASNVLNGRGGADRMFGGAGADVYVVDDPGDQVSEQPDRGVDEVQTAISLNMPANIERLRLLGRDDLAAGGNALANVMAGNAGDNVLNGGAGADLMAGGLGDDVYVVDHAGDRVVERLDAGRDLIRASRNLTLPDHVEIGQLEGVARIVAGNALANTLLGTAAANVLNGREGPDRMFGYAGDDAYYVDNPGDRVGEIAGAGVDVVYAGVDYALPDHVETLVMLGARPLVGVGNAGPNILSGNGASNVLNGRGGADQMFGGGGRDVYVVDDPGDRVIEAANRGVDEIRTAVSLNMPANVERLVMLGDRDLDAGGNGLANVMAGNAGDNVLNGGGGADLMAGGLGDDAYVVDDAGDRVVERAGAGRDFVAAAIDHVLAEHVENGEIRGAARILAGNAQDNTLLGNDGDNILNGRAGADRMFGYDGDDVYVTDDPGDRVFEIAGAGVDLVRTAVSRNLESHVERLEIIADGPVDAGGNGLNNALFGGRGDNRLSGGNGDDTLFGGAGADRLTGGSGRDRFVYSAAAQSGAPAATRDVVTDFRIGEDVLDIAAVDADATRPGDQAFAFGDPFVAGAARQTRVGADLLLEFNTDDDAAVEMAILLLGLSAITTEGLAL